MKKILNWIGDKLIALLASMWTDGVMYLLVLIIYYWWTDRGSLAAICAVLAVAFAVLKVAEAISKHGNDLMIKSLVAVKHVSASTMALLSDKITEAIKNDTTVVEDMKVIDAEYDKSNELTAIEQYTATIKIYNYATWEDA